MMKYKFFLFILVISSFGCKEKFTPKPRGFFRISFPEKKYQPIANQFPYQFDIPQYVKIVPDYQNPDQRGWINLEVPENKAEVHISYYNLQNNFKPPRELLAEFMEESRELAYKHSIKANAIEERIFVNPEEKVYGTVYQIEGNAASPIQFFLTDSIRHFLRGALYIRATPDIDSLKPVIEFLERDVIQIIETTKWK
ncbi:MAG: gliding motility lipoprotein GldD [Mariniphaga sp.]|jgi:gliding motility-associated lipoprotein GldD|nr:gliding motility lipoprotein GldD [Mariniphaga sp.]